MTAIVTNQRAGNLLWRRMKVTIFTEEAGPNPLNLINTGICQAQQAFATLGNNEPEMPPVGSVNVASRVNVIPLMPLEGWIAITHDEPISTVNLDGHTTVKVQFRNSSSDAQINVLFWDPHELCGPGAAPDPTTHVTPDNTIDGEQLWTRKRVTLVSGAGAGNLVDTGIWQTNRAFDASSVREPPMVAAGAVGSRLQVIPLAYGTGTPAWNNVSHADPVATVNLDGRTTLKVQFTNGNEGPVTINVLFWDPHTAIGPGEADLYNPSRG